MPSVQSAAPIPIDADLLCGGCGQNLRGVTIDRCPECGRRFDRSRHLSVNIPWERRAGLGRLRAFGRTVSAVSFRPSLLIDPTDNPLTLRAAKGFRLRAVLSLFVPMFLAALAWHLGPARNIRGPFAGGRWTYPVGLPPVHVLLATPWFFATTVVGVFLSLFAVTGMASLFFAPRHLSPLEQQRGVAASYYANALLVWLVPMLGFASFGRWLESSMDVSQPNLVAVAQLFKYAAFTAAGLALLAWWLIPCRLLYGITRSKTRVVIFAIAWPLLCVAASLIILIGLHALVTYVAIVLSTW